MADFYIFVKVRTGSKVFLIYFFYFLCMMPFLSLWILIRQNELGLGSQIKISSRKQGSCAAISLLAGIVFLLEVSVFGHEPCNNNSVLYLAIQVSIELPQGKSWILFSHQLDSLCRAPCLLSCSLWAFSLPSTTSSHGSPTSISGSGFGDRLPCFPYTLSLTPQLIHYLNTIAHQCRFTRHFLSSSPAGILSLWQNLGIALVIYKFLYHFRAILLLAVCVIVTGLLVYCICILCCSPKETKNGLHEEEMENPVRSV